MTNFYEAYSKTMIFEGGYSNDPNDLGGETYKGISRNNWPNWSGWGLVDSGQTNSAVLEGLVSDFYKKEFWDKLKLDNIYNQSVANFIFDTAVNMGISRAVKCLQYAIGFFTNCHIDGVMGDKTLAALDKVENQGILLSFMREYRIYQYTIIVEKNPSQKKFFYGWVKRTLNA